MTAPLLAVPTYRVRLEADQIGVDPLASLSPLSPPSLMPLTSSPRPLTLPSPPRGGENEGEGIMSGVRGRG